MGDDRVVICDINFYRSVTITITDIICESIVTYLQTGTAHMYVYHADIFVDYDHGILFNIRTTVECVTNFVLCTFSISLDFCFTIGTWNKLHTSSLLIKYVFAIYGVLFMCRQYMNLYHDYFLVHMLDCVCSSNMPNALVLYIYSSFIHPISSLHISNIVHPRSPCITKCITKYMSCTELMLLQCGDIERNPGPSTPNKLLSLSHVNARSILARNDEKLGQIFNYVGDYKLDVVAITETWLTINSPNSLLTMDGFCLLNDTPYIRRYDLEGQSESLWIQVETKKYHFILIGVYYRPPGQSAVDRDLFLDDFANSAIQALSTPADSVIIMGDFNDSCIEWDKDHTRSELRNKLYDLTIELGLSQLINEPMYIMKVDPIISSTLYSLTLHLWLQTLIYCLPYTIVIIVSLPVTCLSQKPYQCQ